MSGAMISATISVVMPVYNGAATIREAIDSIVTQSYTDWHLTVHDNCSSDETRDCVAAYDDERITLVRHETHVSPAQSWNRCLHGVTGDFFQLLCADDRLHPTCFEEKMTLATQPQNADVALFSSNRMLVNKKGEQMFEIGFAKQAGRFSLPQVMAKAYKVANPIGDPSVGLVRAATLEGFQFTENYPFYVDTELWLHVLERGDMRHLPVALSDFRVIGSALSGSRFCKNYRDTWNFYRLRIKPFYGGERLRYYLGYVHFTARAFARELLYMLNR